MKKILNKLCQPFYIICYDPMCLLQDIFIPFCMPLGDEKMSRIVLWLVFKWEKVCCVSLHTIIWLIKRQYDTFNNINLNYLYILNDIFHIFMHNIWKSTPSRIWIKSNYKLLQKHCISLHTKHVAFGFLVVEHILFNLRRTFALCCHII